MNEEELVYMNRDKANAYFKLANNASDTYKRLEPIRNGAIDLKNPTGNTEEFKKHIVFLIDFLGDEIDANNRAMAMLEESGIVVTNKRLSTEDNILQFPDNPRAWMEMDIDE